MAKKKINKASAKKTSPSFFQTHRHAWWLLPIFMIVAISFILAYKGKVAREEDYSLESAQQESAQVVSPDGQRILHVRKAENNKIESFSVSNVDGSNKIELLDNQVNAKVLTDINSKNWSLKGNYVFLSLKINDKDLVYVFKSNGEMFQNAKKYLSSSELGFNLAFKKTALPYWQSDTQLVIVPDTTPVDYVYILDVEKETLTKSLAGS